MGKVERYWEGGEHTSREIMEEEGRHFGPEEKTPPLH